MKKEIAKHEDLEQVQEKIKEWLMVLEVIVVMK